MKSSHPRDWNFVSSIGKSIFYRWATGEASIPTLLMTEVIQEIQVIWNRYGNIIVLTL